MEKGYRLVKCPGIDCPVTLRLSVSAANYGQTVEITCPRCLTKCHTTIPTPTTTPEKPASDFSFGDAFGEVFGDLFGSRKK